MLSLQPECSTILRLPSTNSSHVDFNFMHFILTDREAVVFRWLRSGRSDQPIVPPKFAKKLWALRPHNFGEIRYKWRGCRFSSFSDIVLPAD
jgi:hypothetical protein